MYEFKKLKDEWIKESVESGDTRELTDTLRQNKMALADYKYALAEKQSQLKELVVEQEYYEELVMKEMKELNLLELNEIKIGVNAESVEVTDIDKIPDEYIKQKITYEVDKTAVKRAINAGLVIEGARTFRKTKVVIK